MIVLRPRDQHAWDPRPHETKAETKTNYRETETKKVVSRPHWSRDLNIPGLAYCQLQLHAIANRLEAI